ncbi:MAG: protein kinase [Myxococcota bacterium]
MDDSSMETNALERNLRDVGPSPAEQDPEAILAREQIQQRLFGTVAKPMKFGRFIALEQVGMGGMGVVLAAYDPKLDRKVAIKQIRVSANRDLSRSQARLLREAQLMARLAHPNIVAVHDVGEYDGGLYVAMEFVHGQTLHHWLHEQKRSRSEILEKFFAAGRGLEAAHGAGVVHRDFKPVNVMVGDDGRVRVLDFGLAFEAGEGDDHEDRLSTLEEKPSRRASSSSSGLTSDGMIVGTPNYMAPEVLDGGGAGVPADQFAFCVSLWEALYGIHPFARGSIATMQAAMLAGQITEPGRERGVPGHIRRALERGVSRDPRLRWPSMRELLDELARDPVARRRQWGLRAGAAAVAVAATVGAYHLGGETLEHCAIGADGLADVWSPDHAGSLAEAFEGTGDRLATEAARRVTERLDTYAESWEQVRVEACRAQEGVESSDGMPPLTMACLDRRRAGLRGLVETFIDADAGVVNNAESAVMLLPAVEPCADAFALASTVPLPADPEVARAVEQSRRNLAVSLAMVGAGRMAEAGALARGEWERAQDLGFRPLEAEAALRTGSAGLYLPDLKSTEQALTEAIHVGIEVGADATATEALLRRLFVQDSMGRTDTAMATEEFAAAMVARFPERHDLRWLYFNNVALLHKGVGDIERARTMLAESAVEAEKTTVVDQIASMANTAIMEGELAYFDRFVQSNRQAQQLAERELTAGHLFVGRTLFNSGNVRRLWGHRLEARGIMERVVRGWGGPTGADPSLALGAELEIAAIDLHFRELAAAELHLKAVAEILGTDTDSQYDFDIPRSFVRAGILAHRGRWAEALELLRELEATCVRQLGPQWLRIEALTFMGRLLREHGQLADAERVFGEAVESMPNFVSPILILLWAEQAETRRQQGDLEAADTHFEKIRAAIAEDDGISRVLLARIDRIEGHLRSDRREHEQAVQLQRAAVEVFEAELDANDPELFAAVFDLAQAVALRDGEANGPSPEARALAAKAMAGYAGLGPRFSPEHDEVRDWLATPVAG